VPGDQQGGDLQPDRRLVPQVGERVEDRLQMGTGQFDVEVVGESLEVDVRGVHVGVEVASWPVVHVPGGDRDRPHPAGVAGLGHVDRVFGEDHRVVVGERHTAAAEVGGCLGDRLGRGFGLQSLHVAGLADVPVLAELAGQVAADGAEGQHAAARVEVVERLLLDRVDAEPRGAAVGGQHHVVAFAHPDETGAPLAVAELAVARAQVALDPAVVEGVPVACRVALALGGHGVVAGVSSLSFHLVTV